jgi:hypothetical protein
MSINLTRVFSSALVAALLSSPINASSHYIAKNGVFGCRVNGMEEPQFEELVLIKADSLRFAATSEPFPSPIEISGKYEFLDYPCLRMYSLWGGMPYSHWHEDVFERILFNVCDSTLYNFGGDCVKFSAVMNRFLRQNLSDSEMIELFSLFVNTLSVKQEFRPIKTVNDFDKYYVEEIRHSAAFTSLNVESIKDRWNYDSDMEAIREVVGEPTILRLADRAILTMFTWDNRYGNVELWRVDITGESFEVLERLTVLVGVGPGIRGN